MEVSDPERALAIAYAPVATRAALTALFALDERLGGIVATTSEPMIGLMRLAWWREALEKLDGASAPGEPLLQAVARDILPRGVAGATLAQIEHGWSALLDGEPDADAIGRFGRCRGGVMFAIAARLLGADDPRLPDSGEGWALADLTHRHSSAEVATESRRQACLALARSHLGAWPASARPLAALAALARIDSAGDAPRRQGSPRRLLRMLALRLTGR